MATRPDEKGKAERPPILDVSDGNDLLGGIAGRFGFRDRLRKSRGLNLAYRIGVGVVGGLVLVAGIIMIPYPGPGWLVVFAGLAILATEFPWAERVLRFAKGLYDRWVAWLRRQPLVVRLVVMGLTALVVVATLWLLNVFGMVSGWFGLDISWLSSPILGR